MAPPLRPTYTLRMSQYKWIVLLVVTMFSTLIAREVYADSTATAKPPAEGAAPATGTECQAKFQITRQACQTAMHGADTNKGKKSDDITLSDGTKKMDTALRDAADERSALYDTCIAEAKTCAQTCSSTDATSQAHRSQCNNRAKLAAQMQRDLKEGTVRSRNEYLDTYKKLTADRESGSDMGGGPLSGGGPALGGAGGASPPPLNPASVANNIEKPVEKTPEQAREERREKLMEERRQERIDAMGKAFQSLSPMTPLNQAMAEKSTDPTTTQSVNAATKAAAAASGNEEHSSASNDEDIEVGRAGFNALAKRNLDARRALAASMGIKASNLSGTAALRPMQSGGSNGTALNFGNGSGFSANAQGATLDPISETERPSDLPKNFKLGAPTAGGGGGGKDGSSANSIAGLSKKPTKRNANGSSNADEESPTRTPASVVSAEIRPQAADIWQVISVSFRRRCAEGRLMDCADHLPRNN